MPAAKLFASGTPNAMKSEEGNDSLDSFIRQAIGKEPIVPFPRSVDSPAQWIQLLHALDQPDLPGWPLLTPAKVQMQKCKKCSQEFCSPINYRRHIRVHRRSLNINKEWHRNRVLLASFWDKLLLEQAKEIVSFDDVVIKDTPGSSIVMTLASSLHKPGFWTLPQAYVKAGAALLDIIQVKPSGLPVSSQELFSILDDASERTFLCAGTAESVQKYIFDGETAKNSLELKNLVALTSFLFEQLLVKAWVSDKDAEALRCHKLLVEEEDAAQRRQALLLERKKQKNLRQKEQKVREQYYGCSEDHSAYVDAADRTASAEASSLSSPPNSISNAQDMPTTLDSVEPQDKESDEDIEAQFDVRNEHESDEDIEAQFDVIIEHKKQRDSPATELQMVGSNGHWHVATHSLQAPKSQRSGRYGYGLHAKLNPQTLKPEPAHKLGPSKDRSQQNGNKVWAKKLKTNNDGESPRPPSSQEVTSHKPNQTQEDKNNEVIIGSIAVALKNYVNQLQGSHPNQTQDTFSSEHALRKKKNAPAKSSSLQSGTNRVASKHWRPVSRGETKNVPPVDRSNGDPNNSATLSEAHDHPTQSCERSLDYDGFHCGEQFHVERGFVPFSSEAAKEFLARRWKDAISGDHVKLVLSSDPARSNPPNRADNQLGRTIQIHVIRKPEKSVKFKYIPKQKAAT